MTSPALARLVEAADRLVWRKEHLVNQESSAADAEWQEVRDALAAVAQAEPERICRNCKLPHLTCTCDRELAQAEPEPPICGMCHQHAGEGHDCSPLTPYGEALKDLASAQDAIRLANAVMAAHLTMAGWNKWEQHPAVKAATGGKG